MNILEYYSSQHCEISYMGRVTEFYVKLSKYSVKLTSFEIQDMYVI
jgi:hypothetical protein